MRPNREYFWRDRLYYYAVKLAAGVFKRSTSFIRERYIVSVSSNFLTQISCGIKTKCRKTRAMQRDFTIVDSLALRQCDTSMIPDTHLLKLLFLARYTPRAICLYLRTCKQIGAKRRASMYWLTTVFSYSREEYRSSQQQFFNANFVWNQDEVSQNSRYAKRFYYSRQLSAQTMQHFDDSRHSFAKIAIPYTILSLAQFTWFYEFTWFYVCMS